LVAFACCLGAAVGVAYLHGFDRALEHVDWRYRPELIEAYLGEIVFRSGPCVLAGTAALLSAWFRVRLGVASVGAVAVAATSVVGGYLTIRQYVATPPGQFMPVTVWDGVTLLCWAVAAVLVLVVGVAALAAARGHRRQTSVLSSGDS
jgi:hypothetical protein